MAQVETWQSSGRPPMPRYMGSSRHGLPAPYGGMARAGQALSELGLNMLQMEMNAATNEDLSNLDVNLTYESSSVIQRRVDTEVRADRVSQDVVMQATGADTSRFLPLTAPGRETRMSAP